MIRHSTGKTIKYEFDCGKKTHLKIAKEEDGTQDIRILGEKNGTCAKVLLSIWADTVNLALKRQITTDDLIDICGGHSCEHHCIGYLSCVDKMVREFKSENKAGDKPAEV